MVTSDRESLRKYPDPFPEWSVATSAFWNLVWAVKYGRRNRPEIASDYIAAACDKLQVDRLRFSNDSVRTLLVVLTNGDDVEDELVAKLANFVPAQPLAH